MIRKLLAELVSSYATEDWDVKRRILVPPTLAID